MPIKQEHEEGVARAVSELACAIKSGGYPEDELSKLVELTSHVPLSNLGQWERQLSDTYSAAFLRPYSVRQKLWGRLPAPLLTWIDLCSGNGYKREEALRAFQGIPAPNAFFLVLAFRRLNDWVPEVRSAAREVLPRIAQQSSAAYVAEALCATLAHWTSWGRMEEWDKEALMKIVAVDGVSQALVAQINANATGPMTVALAQLGRANILDEQLPQIASHAIQPWVRARAYRSLLEGRVTWVEGREWKWTDKRYCEGRYVPVIAERKLSVVMPVTELINAAAVDKSPIVRRIAGEFLIKNLDAMEGKSLELAGLLAGDASPSVAERGRFALKALNVELS